jgi:hypothetical protein
MGDFPELPTLVDAAPLERKPLQFIVMSAIIVISVTFPYIYRGFLHDGELMGCLGTVMPSLCLSSWREWLR